MQGSRNSSSRQALGGGFCEGDLRHTIEAGALMESKEALCFYDRYINTYF